MKNLIAIVSILSVFALSSCQKTEITPTANGNASNINVQYYVESESGHFTVDYLVMEGNQMVEKQFQIDRSNYSVSFAAMSGYHFKVKASNSTPSQKDIKVSILVNGVVFKFNEANAPGAVAIAEGTY